MQSFTGIKTADSAEAAKQLSHLLADEFVLYTKTLNAHWNIEGGDFYNKHLFYESLYNKLSIIIDEVAERIRSLGHYAPATLSSFLELTHLTEKLMGVNTSISFMEELLEDHVSIIVFLRKYVNEFGNKLKDFGSSDFITGLIEKHEKMAWMLRAHLS